MFAAPPVRKPDKPMLQLLMPSPWPLAILALGISVAASIHILLTKRDVRAASGWFVIVWLLPLLGAALYLMLGINRIRRKALRLRKRRRPQRDKGARRAAEKREKPALSPSLYGLFKTVSALTDTPLLPGNRFEILENGDATYEAMLAAIAEAKRTVALASYIFCRDEVGERFVEALKAAQDRGVEVRVLVDGVGVYYSFPTILGSLGEAGVQAAAFLPTWVPGRWLHMNLRNHRKILVVDGVLGFTGGVNIQACNLAETDPRRRVLDVHFRITGPVVAQVAEAFIEDWAFASGELLSPETWLPHPEPQRDGGWARGIAHGPDSEEGPLSQIILAAVNQADQTVRVVSPYFLPDEPLMSALCLAAKRGVEVTIVTPRRPGLNPVEWAAESQFDRLLAAGCRLFASGPVFDHAKLMTIDGAWSLIGSSNWDPRSLRLNFEFNVEVYDPDFAAAVDAVIARRAAQARALSQAALKAHGRARLLRNRLIWLFQPYL